MQVDQISVFIENKAGRLSEVTGILAEAGVNIRALALADTSDFGVLRLIVDNNDAAISVLKENGFTVGKNAVIAAEVKDEPGGLHQILDTLKTNGINVEYMYAFVRHSGENAVMIFRFDDVPAAIKVMQKTHIKIIDGEQLNSI
ncbi:MAG: ACT domain-containing protein [Desulfobacteraceae bacterium]